MELQQLSKLPFIPDRQHFAQICAADTNRRLHVALKHRLTDVIVAAHQAYIALEPYDHAQSVEKLSALPICSELRLCRSTGSE